MIWEDYTIESDKITLTRQEIEEARDHYLKVADKLKPKKGQQTTDNRYMFYLGKADVLIDTLKMFDSLGI